MAYKSNGEYDVDALVELGFDITELFDRVSDAANDVSVVEVGDNSAELWYSDRDEGWVEAGTFETIASAMDAAAGFEDGEAVGVYHYGDRQAKLMVWDGEE